MNVEKNLVKQALQSAIEESVHKAEGKKDKVRKFDESVDIIFNVRDVDLKNPNNRIEQEHILPHVVNEKPNLCFFAEGDMELAVKSRGIPVINVGPSGSKDVPEDLPRVIDMLAKMAEKAEPFGVTLCVKAHVNASIWNTPTTLKAMSTITSPAFGIDMDPSHIHRGGEVPKDALKQVISRVRHVHIRDCAGSGPSPGQPELQACGRGDIDLWGYCVVLAEAGYDGPMNLEIIGAAEYPLERCAMIAAESYGYLNACLQGCNAR